MRQLSELQATSPQRPDGVSWNEISHKIGLIYEVQSSPMAHTVKKAIFGAANVIRLLRNEKVEFSEITVFALPSITEMSCIVEIMVKWGPWLQFVYRLKCFKNVTEGLERIREVFEENIKTLPRVPRQDSVRNYFIRLTKDEIRLSSDDDDGSNCVVEGTLLWKAVQPLPKFYMTTTKKRV